MGKESIEVQEWDLNIVLVLINIEKVIKICKYLEYNNYHKLKLLLVKYSEIFSSFIKKYLDMKIILI